MKTPRKGESEDAVLVYLLRFLTFWLKLLALVLVLVLLGVFVFLYSMDTTNINIMLADGMKARAESVIIGGDRAEVTDTLSKYFTWDFLSRDQTIQSVAYSRFVVRSIQYKLDTEWVRAMPWDQQTEVLVTEEVLAIDGELPKSSYTEQEAASGQKIEPPKWPHARYLVRLVRSEDRWKIDRIDLVERIADEAKPTPTPAKPTPTPAES